MDVFEVAAVALAFIEESSLPVAPGMSRGDVIDRLYETSTGESERADKVAFVVAAGGEL